MSRSDKALTFAREMLVHGDEIRAARAAGYAGDDKKVRSNAKALMKHRDVRDILETVSRKQVLVAAVTEAAVKQVGHELDSREGKRAFLKRIADGTTKRKITNYDGDEIETETSIADRLVAAKMLWTMDGELQARVHVTGEQQHTVFVIPHNGRGPLPPGATVEVDTLPERLSDALSPSTDTSDTEGEEDGEVLDDTE